MAYVPAPVITSPGVVIGNFQTKNTWGPGEFTHSGCREGEGCDKGRQYENGKLGKGSCGCRGALGEFRYTCLRKSYSKDTYCPLTFPVQGTITGGDYIDPMSIQVGGCDTGSHRVQQYCTYSTITNAGDLLNSLHVYFDEPHLTNIKRGYCNNIDFATLASKPECDGIINRNQRLDELSGINWYRDSDGISKFKTLCDTVSSQDGKNILKSKISSIPTNFEWSKDLITMLNSLFDSSDYHDVVQNAVRSYCSDSNNQMKTACTCANAVFNGLTGCTSGDIPGCETGYKWKTYLQKPTTSDLVKNTINQFYKPMCTRECSPGEANTRGILRASTINPGDCPDLNIQNCQTQMLTGGSIVNSKIEQSCNFPPGSLSGNGNGLTLQNTDGNERITGGEEIQTSSSSNKTYIYVGILVFICCVCMSLLLGGGILAISV